MSIFDDPKVEAPNIPDPWDSYKAAMQQLTTTGGIGRMNEADLMRQLQANQQFQGKGLQQQLDLSKRYQPLFFEQEKKAVLQREKAIADMMERYGAQFKRADESLQPEVLKELGRQVLGQLKTEGGLSTADIRNFQQDARVAQQARGGLTLGAAPVAEEARLGARERRQRKKQDWGDAQSYLGTLRGYEKDWGQRLAGGFGATPSILSTPNVQQGMTGAGLFPRLSEARTKRDYEQAMADFNAEQLSGGSSQWGQIGQIAGTAIGAYFGGQYGAEMGGQAGGQIGGMFDSKPSRYSYSMGGYTAPRQDGGGGSSGGMGGMDMGSIMSMFGGGGGSGGSGGSGSYGSMFSDIRLKDNIALLEKGTSDSPNIYSFNYRWDKDTKWRGVMAQELLDTKHSDAVTVSPQGFYMVDYTKLGFPMTQILN